jgi:hypothetical protein
VLDWGWPDKGRPRSPYEGERHEFCCPNADGEWAVSRAMTHEPQERLVTMKRGSLRQRGSLRRARGQKVLAVKEVRGAKQAWGINRSRPGLLQ